MDRKHKHSSIKKYQIEADRKPRKRKGGNSTALTISDFRFEITQEVLEYLSRQAQTSGNEQAGILIGSEIGDHAYRVNKASEPCEIKQKATKIGCVRNAKKANEIIIAEFEKSNGTRVYLGEWHTHPEDYPSPSHVDTNSIKTIIETGDIPAEGVFLIIIGLKQIYYGFHYNGKLYDITPVIV